MYARGDARETAYDPSGDADEELRPAPAEQLPHVLAAAGLVVVLLAALGAVRIVEHRAPARVIAVQHSLAPVAAVPTDMGVVVALQSSPFSCPPTIACTRRSYLPTRFIAAVASYLPTAVAYQMVAITQTNPPRVYYRRFDAVAGRVAVTVQVTRSDILDGLASSTSSRTTDGVTSNFVRLVTPDEYEAVVEARGPSAEVARLGVLRTLAADPRLLAID